MINVSNEYSKIIIDSGRKQYGGAVVTLVDGTILNLDSTNILDNGITIKDGTSSSGNFEIGSAIINELTLKIANFDNEFSLYDFTGAIIRPKIGLQLSATIETISKGIFTVDESKAVGSTIVITALDNMNKFDFPFSGMTLNYPITAFSLLQEVCEYCGVSLETLSFLNDDYSILESPSDEAITCREIVSYIAQISGNFARINVSGSLELKWYNIAAFENGLKLEGGTFDSATPYASGNIADGGDFTYSEETTYDSGLFTDQEEFHSIYSLSSATIGTDDIVITGIQVTDSADEPTTVLFGESGYVLSIEENPLILNSTQAQWISQSVGESIVGMSFRALSVSALSNPSIEAGDVAYVTDRKGNSYQTLITNINYTIGSYESITCDAETPSKNNSVRYSAATKAIVEARKLVKEEKTARELAIEQLNGVITNSSGLYQTVTSLPDDSKIYYLHDKPTIEESLIVWKMTAEAFGVSTDGGVTYSSGMTADGDIVAQRLSIVGINADWINTGTLTSMEIDNGNGAFTVDADGHLVATSAEITGNITGSTISGSTIQGNTIKIGGDGDAYGKLQMLGTDGGVSGTIGLGYGINFPYSDIRGAYFYGSNTSFSSSSLGYAKASSLMVYGSKSRAVKTEHYGTRLMNAYETPTPYFGDIGSDTTNENGECIIGMEEIFKETIDLRDGYKVFIQECGNGRLWVEKSDNYFTVKGEPNLAFDWEIKAPQRDYIDTRLIEYIEEREEELNGDIES